MGEWIKCFVGLHDWDEFGECRRNWHHVQRRFGDWEIYGGPWSRVAKHRHQAKVRAGEALQAEFASLGEDVSLQLCMDAAGDPHFTDLLRGRVRELAARRPSDERVPRKRGTPMTSQAAHHNEGSCDLCTGWHDAEEVAFMNRRASQAAQEKPTSPRTRTADNCSKCGAPGFRIVDHRGDGSVRFEREAATPSLDARRFGKAIRNTGTDWNIDDIGRVLNEYDALSASSEPSKAAATPSLDRDPLADAIYKRIPGTCPHCGVMQPFPHMPGCPRTHR